MNNMYPNKHGGYYTQTGAHIEFNYDIVGKSLLNNEKNRKINDNNKIFDFIKELNTKNLSLGVSPTTQSFQAKNEHDQ